MHYLTQGIAILLTIFILVIWLVHKKTGESKESIFSLLLFIALISEIIDILCQFAIAPYPFVSSPIINEIIIKLYLVTLVFFIFFAGIYASRYTYSSDKIASNRKKIYLLIVISAIVISVLPIDYGYHPNCSFPSGTAVYVTTIIVFVAVILNLISIIKNRKNINKWVLSTSVIWLFTFSIGTFVQLFTIHHIHLPVISINMAIGLMFIYLCIENPGSRFDYDTECFCYKTFIDSINEILEKNDIVSCIMINLRVKNIDNLNSIDQIYKELVLYFKNKDIRFYNGVSNEMYALSKNYEEIQNIKKYVIKAINDAEFNDSKIKIYSSFVILPDVAIIRSYRTLKYIFDSYKTSNLNIVNNNEETIIDKEIAKEFDKRFSVLEEIDLALKNDGCVIDYRIITNAFNNKVYAEAFANLNVNENKKMFTPDYYETAVKYDRLKEIRESKFKKIKEDIEKILSQDNKLDTIFVHTSVQELEIPDYYEEFSYAFESNRKVLSKMCIVIFNIDTISDKETLLSNIKELQKFDVKFAISGFGSGESNLNYFIDLPIQFVIYDKEVLNKISIDESALNVIEDITNLARSLNYDVVATFDEANKDDINRLKNINMFLNESNELLNNTAFVDYAIKGGEH